MSGSPGSPKEAAKKEEQVGIQVHLRVRPFNSRELELHNQSQENKTEWDRRPLQAIVAFDGGNCTFHSEASDEVGGSAYDRTERFNFNKCYWSVPPEVETSPNGFATQEDVFDGSGMPLLQSAMDGYNSCLFAYGQTGAGKTFSVSGADFGEMRGITPRLAERLFSDIKEKMANNVEAPASPGAATSTSASAAASGGTTTTAPAVVEGKHYSVQVTVRYLEIYNEQVKDLLWNLNTLPPEIRAKTNPENLRVRNNPATGVFVEHLTGVPVETPERMLELIELGQGSRTVAATKMNERSSRSHAIFKIEVRQITQHYSGKQFEKPTEHIRDATINLVDLAGSERNKKTGAEGQRLKEAANINKSLSCLKNVIDVLVDNSAEKRKDRHKKPPYRDSTLTSLLADSLGGNSKTCMLVCISPHSDNAEETLQTLKYASKARQIVTTVHCNENAAGRLLLDMEDQLTKLREAQKQLNFAETAEGHAKMALMKSDIEEKTDLQQMLDTQLKKSRESTAKMKKEISRLKVQDDAKALRNMKTHIDDWKRARDPALRFIQAEARYEAQREKLKRLEEHLAESEFSSSQVENQIEANRAALDSTEVELDLARRRNAKLDLSRRELVRSVSEQEQQIRQMIQRRISEIMSAKVRVFRLKQDQKKHLISMTRDHERAKADLAEKHRKDIDTQRSVTSKHERDASSQLDEVEKKHVATKLAAAKVEQDREMQVQHLEKDLENLKKERERITALSQKRLERSRAEWEARDQRGKQKAEQALQSLRDEFQLARNNAVEQHKENAAKAAEKWREDEAKAEDRVRRELEEAENQRKKKVSGIEEQFRPAIDAERNKTHDMIKELKTEINREDDFSQLAHAITTQWEHFPQLARTEEFAEKSNMATSSRAASSSRGSSRSSSPSSATTPRNNNVGGGGGGGRYYDPVAQAQAAVEELAHQQDLKEQQQSQNVSLARREAAGAGGSPFSNNNNNNVSTSLSASGSSSSPSSSARGSQESEAVIRRRERGMSAVSRMMMEREMDQNNSNNNMNNNNNNNLSPEVVTSPLLSPQTGFLQTPKELRKRSSTVARSGSPNQNNNNSSSSNINNNNNNNNNNSGGGGNNNNNNNNKIVAPLSFSAFTHYNNKLNATSAASAAAGGGGGGNSASSPSSSSEGNNNNNNNKKKDSNKKHQAGLLVDDDEDDNEPHVPLHIQLQQHQELDVPGLAQMQIPKSFFLRLVEFQRSHENNGLSKHQILQIVHTAERCLEGARDVTSVISPLRLV